MRSRHLTVIDTGTLRPLATVAVGPMPYGVAPTPDGRFVVVSNQQAGTVSIVDAATLAVAGEVAVGRYPEGVLAAAADRVAVANWFSGDLSLVDPAARREVARLGLAEGPRSLAGAP